jgi:pyruvate/2-oxoglutarate/acetoin dehydrogenase E1 component
MSGGTVQVPLVMRALVGATGRGSQHAQSMERSFTGILGLKVVAVSNAYDAKGLLKAAVRDDNPVLIFEHKLLYGSKGARTEPCAVDATSDVPEVDYIVPLDRAAVRREGTQVTILAWLLMLHHALQAALELAASGIDCEVIDVRSLAPIDYATIAKSVAKTGRVVIVEEGPKTGGVSGEIAARLMEHCSESLISPVVRVASADVPVPFTPCSRTPTGPTHPELLRRCASWCGTERPLPSVDRAGPVESYRMRGGSDPLAAIDRLLRAVSFSERDWQCLLKPSLLKLRASGCRSLSGGALILRYVCPRDIASALSGHASKIVHRLLCVPENN